MGRAMAEALSPRPLAAEDLVRSHVSPCEICSGQGSGTGFSPSTLVSPRQYHSTDVPYSFSSTQSLTKSPMGEEGEFSKNLCPFGNQGTLHTTILHFFILKELTF
jgi:hypothetical protein